MVVRDKARADAEIRNQLLKAKESLQEEALVRQGLQEEVDRYKIESERVEQDRQRQKEIFESTLRDLDITNTKRIRNMESSHGEEVVCIHIEPVRLTLTDSCAGGIEEADRIIENSTTT